MKILLKLAVLALGGTAALALAGNALAVQKLSVSQTATSLTIKVSQAQSDPQPAKIQIFVPAGYSLNTSQAPGTNIGTTSGSVFARDANIPLPLSGDVIVAPPEYECCALLHRDAHRRLVAAPAGRRSADPAAHRGRSDDGRERRVRRVPARDVPRAVRRSAGHAGRSPNGAQLLEAVST